MSYANKVINSIGDLSLFLLQNLVKGGELMELMRVVCTTCGNSLNASLDENLKKCDACGNTFLVTNGLDFAGKTKAEHSSIRKLRNNLDRAVVADDHQNILHFSKEILGSIPKDYLANYYYAYANYSFGSRKYLFDFYSKSIENHKDACEAIINHIIEYSDVRDKSQIEMFIARNNPHKLENYRKRYEQKLVDEENYSSIPRDIFISFRSTDIEVADEVLNLLERDGNTCWISSRNLRPNDNENYWINIEDAITKCKLFLVISSQDAMISRDVKKEIDFATKQKKLRIEYKIDHSKHTSYFKYFFDGCKWIDATKDKYDALQELKKRTYDLLHSTVKTTAKQTQTDTKSGNVDNFTLKLNRAKVELVNGGYESAVSLIKDALSYDAESSDAWWMLFLAENQFSSTEHFISYITGSQTLARLFDLYNRSSYKQFKTNCTFEGRDFPVNIKKFEDELYKQIIEYINYQNLAVKAKKDFLNSYSPQHILTLWANKVFHHGFEADSEIENRIDDDLRIKQLENIFDDLEDVKNHKEYSGSHVEEYVNRFTENFAITVKRREQSLKTVKETIDGLYKESKQLLQNKKYKQAMSKALELFYYDNSNPDKYLLVLLAKIKARNTIEAYDAINKTKKKEKYQFENSIIIQQLFDSEKYHDYMEDLMFSYTYKKRKKSARINIDIRGDLDGV